MKLNCFYNNEKCIGKLDQRWYDLPKEGSYQPLPFTCEYHNDYPITYELIESKRKNGIFSNG